MLKILTCFALVAVAQVARADGRPNIVMLFADDLGRYASAYADPAHPSPNDVVKTPVFDEVADSGARFENAFVSAPSCTPSRASLNTGRHFFRNGSHSQLHFPWSGPPEDDPFRKIKGMPMALEESGYDVGWTYKVHMRMSIIGGKKNLFDGAGGQMNVFSQAVTAAADHEAQKKAILDQVRQNFRNFLATRKKGQPFYYSYNPTNTHRKWVSGSGKELWGLNPDDLKGKLPPFLPDVPVVREDFADYLGEAMAFDASCGVIIDELKKMGEYDNTLVVISGDHGIPGFPRGKTNVHDFGSRVLLAMRWPGRIDAGQVVKPPVSLVDLAPTFLAAAGVDKHERMDGENLLPFLGGKGKMDQSRLRGWALIGREVHAFHGHGGRKGKLSYPVRALRTADYLYVINFKNDRWPAGAPWAAAGDGMPEFDALANNTYVAYPDIDASPAKAWVVRHRDEVSVKSIWGYGFAKRPPEELYVLKNDPFEIHNVAGDPAYAQVKNDLRGRLMDILRAGKDPRLEDAFDKPPYLVAPGK